ncbi:MAG: PASTA domain-containing protein, partial [Vagococcus sp.]
KEMTVDQPETKYEEIFELLDLLNKIYNQKGMQSVTNDPNFKQSVSLIEEINSNFKEVNQIKSSYANFDTLNEPITEPTTRLGVELDSYVFEVNDYIESKRLVTEFKNRYSELQRNLSINKEIIKNSVKTPDLVGLTIEEAQKELSKAKLNLGIRGYTNKNYKNGDRVLESQRGVENWDDDKQDKIMRQEPSPTDYEFITHGSTIQVIVENKPINKPEESTESSSSSIFESSTSSSSSTEETTSTTTSSDVND